ncbi:tRNA (adenosine(37)-N6)-threonylcarbamoyltransferase complex ATPase subunit type 1 TsaE [Candidatus Gottesmanbacteria bacterium]|nr:tRNA (adenosine(37)-N6)-threonylcarbamoyltransferase complex ATPase subunit type 1 TsaE [Candidatus Gottesmanbacteria bacterium]
MEIVTKSAKTTFEIGEKIGSSVASILASSGALVFGLTGELGSGKTTFTQGIAKGLGIKSVVQSPTFIIVRHYPIHKLNFSSFYHIDLYRLSDKGQEYDDLGLTEIFSNPQNFVVIEWFDKIDSYKNYLKGLIDFQVINDNQRKITFNGLHKFTWEELLRNTSPGGPASGGDSWEVTNGK